MSARQVIEDWMQRVWNELDVSAIDKMFPSPGTALGLGKQPLVGADDFKRFHAQLCTLLSDIRITIDKCIEDDPWCSVLLTIEATAKSTGRPVVVTGQCFTRVESGVITQAYNHIDFVALFAQLGLLPADAIEIGMSGRPISQ